MERAAGAAAIKKIYVSADSSFSSEQFHVALAAWVSRFWNSIQNLAKEVTICMESREAFGFGGTGSMLPLNRTAETRRSRRGTQRFLVSPGEGGAFRRVGSAGSVAKAEGYCRTP